MATNKKDLSGASLSILGLDNSPKTPPVVSPPVTATEIKPPVAVKEEPVSPLPEIASDAEKNAPQPEIKAPEPEKKATEKSEDKPRRAAKKPGRPKTLLDEDVALITTVKLSEENLKFIEDIRMLEGSSIRAVINDLLDEIRASKRESLDKALVQFKKGRKSWREL